MVTVGSYLLINNTLNDKKTVQTIAKLKIYNVYQK